MPRTTRAQVARNLADTLENSQVQFSKEDSEGASETKAVGKARSASKPKSSSPKKTPGESSPDKTKKEKTEPSAKKRKAVADEELKKSTEKGTKTPETPPKKKRTPAKPVQRITERDELPKLWSDEKAKANGSYTFRIASWNVAGLRAFLTKRPSGLLDFCQSHNLDMLCLQETKLQQIHLDDPKLQLRGCLKDAGYIDYWNCSTEKKGYSGTAVFVKQHESSSKEPKQSSIESFFSSNGNKPTTLSNTIKNNSSDKSTEILINPEMVTPQKIMYEIGNEIDKEGRTIIMEFPFATITNVYVPNSGQTLQRLDYRTQQWDKEFLAFQQKLEKDRGLPVIWLGDLNIAHKAYDVWNDGAKHLDKQSGVTPQERASFQKQLDAGYVDAFRKLHPDAKGHYSYWSMRSGNREPNKGLRLDYFVCSPELFKEESKVVIRDSYMVPECLGSDHSPVVLEIELKK